ncbi:Uncharacterised protein [Segatella copri]|nr:Uncharacterised protein [Segatella copri]
MSVAWALSANKQAHTMLKNFFIYFFGLLGYYI